MDIKIREANSDDAKPISDLVISLTDYFSIDHDKDAAAFFETLTPESTADRLKADMFCYYVAEDNNNKLCGVIGLRDDSHIYHLFVSKRAHGQGIGRILYNYVKTLSTQSHLTVNSSPYAVPFYQRLGFVATEEEQTKDGLLYLPMRIQL